MIGPLKPVLAEHVWNYFACEVIKIILHKMSYNLRVGRGGNAAAFEEYPCVCWEAPQCKFGGTSLKIGETTIQNARGEMSLGHQCNYSLLDFFGGRRCTNLIQDCILNL